MSVGRGSPWTDARDAHIDPVRGRRTVKASEHPSAVRAAYALQEDINRMIIYLVRTGHERQ